MTMGADRPPNGTFHARFSPEGDHFEGRFFSADLPSRFGPRHSGQSAAKAAGAQRIDREMVTIVKLLRILEMCIGIDPKI
jgi:hypothetical protein